MTPEQERAEREAALMAHWRDLVINCRDDVNTFVETCFRDDQTPGNLPFKQQWFHREWQEAWQTQRISVLHGACGFGKSDQAVAHLIWRIAKNPKIRILIVSKTDDKAKELSAKIKRQIDENETLRAIFPNLRAGDPWGVETFRVAGAGIDTTTNTVTTYGIATPKAGPRADIVLLDDINDEENTRNEERRNHTLKTVDSVIQTRLTTHGQMMMLANAWHPKDVAFTYSARPGVWYRAYPAIYPDGRLLWPSFRPLAWLNQIRETMTPIEFARMFLCQARDEGTRVFHAAWFKAARLLGNALRPMHSVKHMFDRDGRPISPDVLFSPGWALQNRIRIAVGVDLATGKTQRKRKTDMTVFFVLGLLSDMRRQLLWIEKGRWPAGESIRRLRDIELRYRPEAFFVEDNGTQSFFHEFTDEMLRKMETPPRIEPFTTDGTKWDASMGIESIGIELQANRWLVPDAEPMDAVEEEAAKNIASWETHMLDFDRVGHTPDDVMAGWFAQQGLNRLDALVFADDNRVRPPSPFDELFPPLADDSPLTQIPAHIRASFGL